MHVLEKSFIVLERYLKVNYSLNSLFFTCKTKKNVFKNACILAHSKNAGLF